MAEDNGTDNDLLSIEYILPENKANMDDPVKLITEHSIMAELSQTDVFVLADQHSTIRSEAVDHTNEIVRETIKGDYNTLASVERASHNITNTVESIADRIDGKVENAKDTMTNRMFDVARDTYDLRAQVTQVLSEVKLVGANTSKDNEIAILKSTIEGQKNTQFLAEKIAADGGETRRLINELKYSDLNRELIERNSELRHHDHYRHVDPSQFAAQMASMQSQIQAFASQMSDTRQSLVNLGTMFGSGQTSSTNNVR